MALSERFDKQTRINEAEVVNSGEPSQREQIRAGGEAGLDHVSVLVLGTYSTNTEGASSSCFSFLFMSSETVE